MQYDVPEKVKLRIILNEDAQAFLRRCLMEAAKLAGLPLLEQASFADYYISLGSTIHWKDEDPTPNDNIVIKNNEIKSRHGSEFNYWLTDEYKDELRRRQAYYVLNGGLLGSMKEVSVNDAIVIDLNIVYEKNQYSETRAKEIIQPQLDIAVKCYNEIEIKFYVVWTAGEGSYEESKIIGRREGFVNVLLIKSKLHNSVTRTDAVINETDNKILTRDIFLLEGQFKNRGFWGSDLAHELAHKFGIATYLFKIPWTQMVMGNIFDDVAIYAALGRMWTGLIIKYVHWGKPPLSIRVSKEFQPTIFDYLRGGAKALSRKN